MKNFFLIITAIVFTWGSISAQSTALSQQIELDKKEAANEGYTLLDSGGGETNWDWVLTFDMENYYSGYIYYAVAYFEGCSNCDVGFYFYSHDNGGKEELSPKIDRSQGVIRATYGVQQTKTAHGELSVYAKSTSKVYTYSMLFRKSLY